MSSFWADPAKPHDTSGIHPALTRFADEVCGTLARLMAYVMTLALLAMGCVHAWEQLPDAAARSPAEKGDWSLADRSSPAFAVTQFDSRDKAEAYDILRHPEGGRKDVFRWTDHDQRPIAELAIYRPGGELSRSGPAIADLAARMDPNGAGELEAAGLIDSKFGALPLLRFGGGADNGYACLGFLKRIDEPNLRISGWSCQGDNLATRRAAIGCLLNRLTLLGAGNDPKLAEFFARAELKRGSCAAAGTTALSADWVTGTETPRLHGAL
jgi:hypothetical protein